MIHFVDRPFSALCVAHAAGLVAGSAASSAMMLAENKHIERQQQFATLQLQRRILQPSQLRLCRPFIDRAEAAPLTSIGPAFHTVIAALTLITYTLAALFIQATAPVLARPTQPPKHSVHTRVWFRLHLLLG